jgi:hypothetical protein
MKRISKTVATRLIKRGKQVKRTKHGYYLMNC